MNWELIRIIIDIMSVLTFVIMIVVLYVAYKSYKKVTQPLSMIKGLLGNQQPEIEEDKEGDEDNSFEHNVFN